MRSDKDGMDTNMAREARILRRELIPRKGRKENIMINVPMQFKMTNVLVSSGTDSVFIDSFYFNRVYHINSDCTSQLIRLGIHDNPLSVCAMGNDTRIFFSVPDYVASQHRIAGLFSIGGEVSQEIIDAVTLQGPTQELFKVELLDETIALENGDGSERLLLSFASLRKQNDIFTIAPEYLKEKAAGFRYDLISFRVKLLFADR